MSISVKPDFSLDDFVTLALSLRQPLANHEVPAKSWPSLIEDVVFHVAVLIDEKTGSDFHESIFAALRKHTKELGRAPAPVDVLLAEVEIIFGKGRKAELNVLRSGMVKPRLLRLVLEVALGVRDTTEIEARIDTDARFTQLLKKKGGIKAVRFKRADAVGRQAWQELKPRRSARKPVGQSIDGLLACIRAAVARQKQSPAPAAQHDS